jgi:hypothetical protein
MTRTKAYNVFAIIVALTPIIMAFVKPALPRDLGQWEETTPEVRQWYETLMQPDLPNVRCCGEADAYWADGIEVVNGQTYAIITDTRDDGPLRRPHLDPGTKVLVPNHKLKWDKGNPTGHAIIFMNGGQRYPDQNWNVLCFVQNGGV